MKNLVKRLKDKTAVIGVIGLGYVGLPLCLRFINKKFKVIGIENNLQKIDQLFQKLLFLKFQLHCKLIPPVLRE